MPMPILLHAKRKCGRKEKPITTVSQHKKFETSNLLVDENHTKGNLYISIIMHILCTGKARKEYFYHFLTQCVALFSEFHVPHNSVILHDYSLI